MCKIDNLFLIGGHDLEMIEIKKILIENNQEFLDFNLSWGAKLSSYQNILNSPDFKLKKIVGIELINDIQVPENFINIDHHNEFSYLPSSIEQVANFLKIELSNYQKLVAINDVSHIKGLKKAGVTQEEINEIRKKDRQSQGVTNEEELLALEEIKNKEYFSNICIIKTNLDKISPLVDRLEEENLIIYSDKTLIYFGKNRNKLVIQFDKYVKEKIAFYGGTDEGYFGFVNNIFSKNEIYNFLEEIKLICQNNIL